MRVTVNQLLEVLQTIENKNAYLVFTVNEQTANDSMDITVWENTIYISNTAYPTARKWTDEQTQILKERFPAYRAQHIISPANQ